MSIGVICIFDPAIFDPNIFTCCGQVPVTGGAADNGVGEERRKKRQREEDKLEKEKIERKRRYDEWRIAHQQSKKIEKKLAVPKKKEEIKEKKTPLGLTNPQLAEVAAKQVAQSVIYRIYQDAERQKLAEFARKEAFLRDEEEAFLLLMSD